MKFKRVTALILSFVLASAGCGTVFASDTETIETNTVLSEETALSDSALEGITESASEKIDCYDTDENFEIETDENAENETSEADGSDSINLETAAEVDLAGISASGSCGDNCEYTLYSDGSMIISGTGEMSDLSVDDNLEFIKPWPSEYNESIKTVTIEEGITRISGGVFKDCTALTSVAIPKGVKSIGYNAFEYCSSLTSITLPDGLTTIGAYAFDFCEALTSITVPASVVNFETYVFFNTGFKTAGPIGGGYDYEFGWTEEIPGNAFFYSSIESVTLPSTITVLGENSFSNIPMTNINLPDGLITIGSGAFYETKLTSITIPDSVTTIGYRAFMSCSYLTKVTIPASVETVGYDLFRNDYFKTAGPIGGGYDIEFGWTEKIPSYAFSKCYYLTSVELPSSITEIGNYAFNECSSLTNIKLPEGLKIIGYSSFYKCYGITSFTAPSSLEHIYGYAFCGSGLTSAALNEGLLSIGGLAFSSCLELTSITIPESVESMSDYAFSGCSSLENVVIKSSLSNGGIEYRAFSGCSALKSITIAEGTPEIGGRAFEGCSSLTSIDIPSSVSKSGNYAFSGCTSLKNISLHEGLQYLDLDYCTALTEITLPEGIETIHMYCCSSLKSIRLPGSVSGFSFSYCTSLTSAELAEGIENIPYSAFIGCTSLAEVTIPESVKIINSLAFSGCTALTSITIPEGVTSIAYQAFGNCTALTNITIHASVRSIYDDSFEGCSSLKTVYCYENSAADNYSLYPDGVTIIYIGNAENTVLASGSCGDDAEYVLYYDGTIIISGTGEMDDYLFASYQPWYEYNDIITYLIVENGITTIGSRTFYDCSVLKNVSIADSVTKISYRAFYNCSSLNSIVIPASLTSTGDGAFDGTAFETAGPIGGGYDYEFGWTEEIPKYAFEGIESLTSVVLPDSITAIGISTFNGCISLISINIPESVTSIGTGCFEDTAFKTAGPTGGGYDYEFGWTETIPEYAFYKCTSLTSVALPDSITAIETNVFYGCKKLTGITLPDGITVVGSKAFYDCTSLTSVNIPKGLTNISSYTFYNCSSLTGITIPKGITEIGSYAFDSCSSLKSIIIPNSVTSLGSSAFNKCTSLTSVTIPEGVTSLGNYAFNKCTSLTNVTLAGSIKSISSFSFSGCTSLASITIPEGISSIAGYAFSSCTALTSVTIASSVTSIKDTAFNGCSALEKIYCYRNSAADDSSLYPEGVTILYLDDGTTESTTSVTESTSESTTASPVTETSSETTTEGEFVSPPAFGVAGVFGGRNVTFTSETDGAVIYYSSTSSTLTTDDISVSNGETVLFEDFYGTIYARAYYNGSWSNVARLILKIPVVNTPTVTASGSVVTVKSTTPSSFICYTTDGSEPVIETDGTVTNGTWLRVNGARTNSGTITAEPGDTVRAVAVRNCFTTSASAAVYVAVSPAAFTVVGTFGGRNVTFKSDTAGAKIYYSSTTSSLTTSDKCVSNGETVLFEDFYGTIYARAYYNGKWSNVSRLILKIPTINDPTITYSGGKATIRTTTPNCYIYYTTDGTTPSITNGKKLCSNSYGQITVSSGTTIKAIAVRSCFTNSEVVSYTVS